ncbi:MAG: SDR family NAD(P)-dependent oxidoreductase [Sulfolobales archaeon]
MSRTAVITGASSGIGRELAYNLAEKRFNLILIARRKEVLENISRELKSLYSVDSYVVSHDLSLVDKIDLLVEKILSITSDIDVLINNAGAGIYGSLQELGDEDIVRIINLNLIAPILLSKKLLPYIVRRRGCIVNISSLAGYLPIPWLEIYSSTKAALSLFTDALRIELKPYGVRVIGVLPGYVATDFHKNTITTKTSSMLRVGFRGPVLDPERVAREIVEKILDESFNDNLIPSRIYRISYVFMRIVNPLVRYYISRDYVKKLRKTNLLP